MTPAGLFELDEAASAVPDLYALRALRALNEADVLVLVEGIGDAALEPARRDARRIRERDPHVAALRALEMAQQGARVVLLHSGEGDEPACEHLQAGCARARIGCRRIPAVR